MREIEVYKTVFEENLPDRETIRRNVLDAAHREVRAGSKNEGVIYIMKKKYIAIPAACCLAFVLLVNSSSAFADSVAQVPVLGSIAKAVTIREYTRSSDAERSHIKVPHIADTGNTELEKKINGEIDQKIQMLADQAEAEAKEYKKNWLAMGNAEADFIPMDYIFDYKVHGASESTLSFVIQKTERNNTVQKINDQACVPEKAEEVTLYIYNLNLKTGKEITLKDLLGSDYKKIANREVERQVKLRAEKNPNLWSYYQEYYATKGARGIEDNEQFYINEKGNPVLVFDKYVIAPENAGPQEYEIPRVAEAGTTGE